MREELGVKWRALKKETDPRRLSEWRLRQKVRRGALPFGNLMILQTGDASVRSPLSSLLLHHYFNPSSISTNLPNEGNGWLLLIAPNYPAPSTNLLSLIVTQDCFSPSIFNPPLPLLFSSHLHPSSHLPSLLFPLVLPLLCCFPLLSL